MKNRVRTNNVRTIKKSFPRFVSLTVMSLLGVFVFAGLMATSPDMKNTLDNYLDKYDTYDIRIISDMGLTQEDVDEIEAIEGVDAVQPAYSVDAQTILDDVDVVINVASLPDGINNLELIEGRLPESGEEIVVERNFLILNDMKIGDSIEFLDSDGGEITGGVSQQEVSSDGILVNNKVKIVGTVDSPLFYNNVSLEQQRGSTSVGAGKINYYAYMLPENFNQDYYNTIYVTVTGAKTEVTSSDEYVSLVDAVKGRLEDIKEARQDARYRQIYDEINNMPAKNEDGTEKEPDEAWAQLENAKIQLDEIAHPNWYIYDRTGYQTYSDFIDDADSIANLSKIFPIVFFAVAVLVSLISMNRMVEEDRTEIGTLKSLGFSNRHIMSKYVLFSLSATIVGGIIGAAGGLIIIPKLIYSIYEILFDVPDFVYGVNAANTILGFIIAVVCVCGTSVVTANKVLKEKPSALMRPKAPKKGKRVFLENISFIWKRVKFSNKVTIRNLFRYKKRVIVTVGGIAGCTALMLCGFGIKDSIADLPSKQYDDIYQFDATAYVSKADGESAEDLFEAEGIEKATSSQRIDGTIGGTKGYMFIVENDDALKDIAALNETGSTSDVKLETGKVVITEKLAALNKLSVGDTIDILDSSANSYHYEISAIADNYIEHFIFMDKETYEASGMEYVPNIYYLKTGSLSEDEREELTTQLLKNDEVVYVTFKEALVENAENMLKSLDKVVIILIVLAAMLSFVVLYNLSNININERRREIATLKVLGFYNNEVDSYITKENIILTILGILIGFLVGVFLTKAVVVTVEIDKARFINHIKINSYVYSGVMSAVFTFIVNIITHFNLKKIGMIDSLKSVE